jgi:hypothetical protein
MHESNELISSERAIQAESAQRNVLVLGLSGPNLPLLHLLRETASANIVGTDRSVDAPGRALVDLFLNLSYSETEKIAAALKAHGITACDILCGTTMDAAFESQVQLAEQFSHKRYPPLSTIRRCRNKPALDEWLGQNGYHNLHTHTLSDRMPDHFPVVVKSGSAKNLPIRVINTPPELMAYREACGSTGQEWIVQRLITGQEYRVDIFPDGSHIILQHLGSQIYRNLLPDTYDQECSLALSCALRFHQHNSLTAITVKYDIIVHDGRPYIIDIGFDHPIRFEALVRAGGTSYWEAYLDSMLADMNCYGQLIDHIREVFFVKGSTCGRKRGDLP